MGELSDSWQISMIEGEGTQWLIVQWHWGLHGIAERAIQLAGSGRLSNRGSLIYSISDSTVGTIIGSRRQEIPEKITQPLEGITFSLISVERRPTNLGG